MGIPSLNYFLRSEAHKGITNISIKHLHGKKIVIDTSIYLYKFKGDGGIIENMYIMCTLFKQNNIIPIFIFDGKPPPEKDNTIKQRRKRKNIAENKYNILKNRLDNPQTSHEYNKIKKQMQYLKKKFIRIKNREIKQLKKFLTAYGIVYLEAEGEADILCAEMVLEGTAYACLSEDMDLFVYGCPYVLRHIHLYNQQIILYDLKKILNILQITLVEFRQLCVLVGTDYSKKRKKSFNYYYNLFLQFKRSNANDFYVWLKETNKLICDIPNLRKILSMFRNSSLQIPNLPHTPPINKTELQKILEEDRFIFRSDSP